MPKIRKKKQNSAKDQGKQLFRWKQKRRDVRQAVSKKRNYIGVAIRRTIYYRDAMEKLILPANAIEKQSAKRGGSRNVNGKEKKTEAIANLTRPAHHYCLIQKD